MKKSLLLATFIGGFALAGASYASGSHAHSHEHDEGGMEMSHGSEMKFQELRSVDGYDVSFHIKKAAPGKEMGGSHDLMIKVEQGGKVLTDIVMNTKVVHPNGKSETKKVMKMGDWLMAGYDLGHAGKHQLMILFKTADGKKHKSGVYYTE